MDISWNQYFTNLVKEWLMHTTISPKKVERVLAVLDSGNRQDRIDSGSLQCPELFCPGLRSQPWYDPQEFSWTTLLEENFTTIISDFEKIYSKRNHYLHAENKKLADYGQWGAFYFYRTTQVFHENLALCPGTAALLAKISGVSKAGSAFFSTLSSKTKITAHYGPHNFRIRCHMGIVVPADCFISVGGIQQHWQTGKCLIFDDSFLHYVENNSEHERVILILDTWHPDFNAEEIKLLEYMMQHQIDLFSQGIKLRGQPESLLDF